MYGMVRYIFAVAAALLASAPAAFGAGQSEGGTQTPSARPLEMPFAAEARRDDVTAEDVAASCKDYNRPDFYNSERIGKRAACNGFFLGAASVVALLRYRGHVAYPYCFPPQLSLEQTIGTFMRWAAKRKDLHKMHAAEGVLAALEDAFPCAAAASPEEAPPSAEAP